MSTENTPARKAPVSAAERMRLYRKRRRRGLKYIRVPLEVSEVDMLMRMKLLTEDERHNEDALRAAILELVYRALDKAA